MTCGACGAENRDSRKFCGECGAPLTQRCAACGTVSEPGDRFCGECGTALGTASPPPDRPAAAEIRRVSVLFCDLVGYTGLSESRPAEDVRTLLSGYFDLARTVVTRYGGVVEKFIGDAVMAVWGVPAAHEDDAERAVRAALDLVDAVVVHGEDVGAPLQARVGVVTGRAASIANPQEGLVVGDRVNTAARVQSVAEPGTVLVDDGTRDVTGSAIGYRDAGLHRVKGKAEPLRLWRAERVVAGVGGELRLDGLEAPLVGRTRELTVVKELFHACVEDRRTRLVAISGYPGTGKSRLLWEFEKYVDGLAADVLWHGGRCLAYGEGVSFWALAEMVRQRFGIAQDDPRDVVRDRLHSGLERWVLDPELRDFMTPALAVLLGCDDRELSPQQLVGGWRLFFEHLAQDSPVVLAFEDMQWADGGLLDFVEQLLDWSADRPLFVLVLSRPELFDVRPTLLAGRRNVTTVGLERLPDAAIDALLGGLVPDMQPAARRQIVEQAEGVPLYAVETVRSLIDRGLVERRDGTYSQVGAVDALQVPPTLEALLAARLDALAPVERALVRDVSVLRGSFARAAAEALTDLPADAVEPALEALVRKDVLGIRRDPLSPDRGHYAFVQSLLRTAAYDTLSRRERRERHLRAAEHLRTAFPDDGEEVVEVIAAHYRDAWLAAPGDQDSAAIRQFSVETFERAGHRAALLGAPQSAERAYRAAAELATDDVASARLLVAAAAMVDRAGSLDEALDLYDMVAERHRAAGRSEAAAELVGPASRLLIRLARPNEAGERLRAALRDAAPDDFRTAPLVLGLARVATFQGDGEAMLALSDQALALAAAAGDDELIADAAMTRAHALHYANRIREALALLCWAADLLGPEGNHDLVVRVLNNQGLARLASDLPGAELPFRASLEAARRVGDAAGISMARGSLAALDLLRGRWDELEQQLSTDLDESRTAPEMQLRHSALAALHSLRGEPSRARDHLSFIADWKNSEDPWLVSAHAGGWADVALATGQYEEALQHAKVALDNAVRFGLFDDAMRSVWPIAVEAGLLVGELDEVRSLMAPVADAPPGFVPPFLRALLARFRGRLKAARGELTGVEEDLREAVVELTRLGYPYWRALAQADLAEWLDTGGRGEEAQPIRSEAVATLTGLGAEPALRRIRRAVATDGGSAART